MGEELPQGLWQQRPSLPSTSNQSDSQLLTAGLTLSTLTVTTTAVSIVTQMPNHIDVLTIILLQCTCTVAAMGVVIVGTLRRS